jgi:predicted O-methyltransferase YrrM
MDRAATRARLAHRGLPLVRRILRPLGYDVLRSGPYSPVPDLDRLPASTWTAAAPMPGLELDLDAQLALLRSLEAELAEFTPPVGSPGDERGFYVANPSYGPVDATILHALVRSRRPARVLEVGAGFSTLVIAGAAARNAAAGAPVEHRVVDPQPSGVLDAVRADIDLRVEDARRIPLEELAALEAGDVLFIDTSHAVRPGGEVLYLLLEALPALRPGVLVHVHDVFRPYEYPRRLYEEFGVAWQEQHLLQAFLAFNPRFAPRCAAHALFRRRPAELAALIPRFGAVEELPSAFWFERVEPSAG